MSRSKKDAVGGHNPKPPGYEWLGRRSTHAYEQPGRFAKKRASKLHRTRDRELTQSEMPTEGK